MLLILDNTDTAQAVLVLSVLLTAAAVNRNPYDFDESWITVTLILPACGNNRNVDNEDEDDDDDEDDEDDEDDDNDLLLIDLLVVAIFIYSFMSCVGCDVLYGSGGTCSYISYIILFYW